MQINYNLLQISYNPLQISYTPLQSADQLQSTADQIQSTADQLQSTLVDGRNNQVQREEDNNTRLMIKVCGGRSLRDSGD